MWHQQVVAKSAFKAYRVTHEGCVTNFPGARAAHSFASRLAHRENGKIKIEENVGNGTWIELATYEKN